MKPKNQITLKSARVKVKKESVRSEHDEQVALCNWLRARNYCYFAVPNGANKSFSARMKFKAEGLQSGVPDLILLDDCDGKFKKGIAIEMKRTKGGVQSSEQKEWEVKFQEREWIYLLAKGFEDAREKLESLGY